MLIISLLRHCINREILVTLYNLLLLVYRKVQFAFRLLVMTQVNNHQQQSSIDNHPAFDPSVPSIPISYPIKTIEELESRAYFESFHYPFNRSSVPLPSYALSLPNRRRLLVCHDMQGGYGDDKWVQGGSNPDAYSIWHWHLIDIFVYFSHSLVNLPPPCWTNTAHRHGVKVLGTFLTEWDEGRRICNIMLETEESARIYAERLAELAVALGFDGWLINMEINLEVEQIHNLKEFVSHLTRTMHSSLPGSLVIWYDAITIYGQLKWQDQLNEYNKPFFDICDGIFVNYTWKRKYPKLSAAVSGDRKFDIYMGIDVFGRNTYGGGQWNATGILSFLSGTDAEGLNLGFQWNHLIKQAPGSCWEIIEDHPVVLIDTYGTNVALELLKEDNVSAAIFAPGWVYETKQPPDFRTAQNCWWGLVEKAWGITNNYPKILPFYSNFDQGHGYHISVEGVPVIEAPWNNTSCQGFQPFLKFIDGPIPTTIQVLVDVKEASYNGGGNITFKGFLQDNAHITTRLFQGELDLGNQRFHLSYSVKSEGDSLLGLSLQFCSTTNEKKSVLVASQDVNQFSSKFSQVVIARQIKKTRMDTEWVIYEGSIALDGHKLTDIHAVCYKLRPLHGELRSEYRIDGSPVNYFAILGHISIKNSEAHSYLPPSSSWLVEGQNIKFSSDSQESRTVSLKIIWGLKDKHDLFFPKYNIYVQKLAKPVEGNPDGHIKGSCQYLGVAQVTAFYVSDLFIPSDAYTLKFIIQVCDSEGSCQKLDDAPYFQLDIEGQ